MSHVYTHNYMSQYDSNAHGHEDSDEYYTAQFERDAADSLVNCTSEDVGAVILYYRDGVEVAYFDYDNLVGSVYAMGGTAASHCA